MVTVLILWVYGLSALIGFGAGLIGLDSIIDFILELVSGNLKNHGA